MLFNTINQEEWIPAEYIKITSDEPRTITPNFSIHTHLVYSLNGLDWTPITRGTPTPISDVVYFKYDINEGYPSAGGLSTWTYSGSDDNKITLSGNILYLLHPAGDKYTFNVTSYDINNTFYNWKALVSVDKYFLGTNVKLTVGISNSIFYYGVFRDCTSLVSAPDLNISELPEEWDGRISYQLFAGCTSLVNAPELITPDILRGRSFESMFYGCTSLVNAPVLPATTVGNYEYQAMFQGCTSLVNAPELPATTVGISGYSSMFYGCTSLVNAPELPAMTVNTDGYSYMFGGCTSLVNVPDLPATTVGSGGYSSMFYGCTSLVNAPELLATTVGSGGYQAMFGACTSLVNAPELLATDISHQAYSYMFSGCTSLLTAYIGYYGDIPMGYHPGMFNNISTSGVLYKAGVPTYPNLPGTWSISKLDKPTQNYIIFDAGFTGANGAMTITPKYDNPGVSLQYSIDRGVTWTNISSGDTTAPADSPRIIWFRGRATGTKALYTSSDISNRWVVSPNNLDVSIIGNLNYLLCDEFGDETAPTILDNYAYSYMFQGNSALKKGPVLEAVEIGASAYDYMFSNTGLHQITTQLTTNLSTNTLNWLNSVNTASYGRIYKAGTQYATAGPSTYPSAWTQVQWNT